MALRASSGTSSSGMTKSVSLSVTSRLPCFTSTTERTEFEELHVTLLDGFFLQHLAGNLLERNVHPRLRSDVSGRFVQFKGKLPSQDVGCGLASRCSGR